MVIRQSSMERRERRTVSGRRSRSREETGRATTRPRTVERGPVIRRGVGVILKHTWNIQILRRLSISKDEGIALTALDELRCARRGGTEGVRITRLLGIRIVGFRNAGGIWAKYRVDS